MYVAIAFGTIFQRLVAHVLTAFKSEPTGVALILVNRHNLTSSNGLLRPILYHDYLELCNFLHSDLFRFTLTADYI
jgi:hypothetical protein